MIGARLTKSVFGRSLETASEKAIRAFLLPETVKTAYTHEHLRPELISTNNWNIDNYFLERPVAE